MQDVTKKYYNSTSPDQKADHRWWNLDDSELYQSVNAVEKNIATKQAYRSTQNIRHARLYSNLDILNMSNNIFSNSAFDLDLTNKLALNVVKSCTDTAASQIAKMKPRPIFLTEDGDWSLQNRAKMLTKFVDGSFDQMKIYLKGQRVFVDACVFGTGILKFFIKDNERVECERVLPEELVVDDAEGAYGEPQQMFQNKLVHRDILISMFPDLEDKIIAAQSHLTVEQAVSKDFLKVTEAWKLPSRKGAKDGRHGIVIQNATLFSEDYKKNRFPFSIYRWSPRLTGFYGSGLAEELALIQLEINKLLRTIQRAQHIMCVPRVWVQEGSFNTQHLSNEPGMIGKYKGSPPEFNTAPGMSPEVYQHLENLYKKAYEITGVSMLSANAHKPAGLNSGAALREFDDIESERFQLQGLRWEDVFMDAADIAIDLTRDLAAKNKDLKVKLSSGKYAETIKWSDVKMEETQYVMRKFPTSILPTQPAGKLQKVQELAQAGFIDKDTAYGLLDFPDLEAAKSIQLETQELTRKILAKMVDEGVYMSPEPYMDPVAAQKIAQAYYLNGRNNDVPDERLELVRRFMEDCDSLKKIAASAMPPQGGAPPQAVPQAPPQSDLLPNAPAQGPIAS